MITIVVIVLLILLLFGALPYWPHSANWGVAPSSFLGAVLVILLVLFLMGKL